jgi:hypothetical protein
MFQLKEKASQSLIHQVCEAVGIDETTFMMSLQTHAQNPHMAQFIQAAQHGKMKPAQSVTTPSLSRDKVCQCIDANLAYLKNPETEKKMKDLMKNFPQDDMAA